MVVDSLGVLYSGCLGVIWWYVYSSFTVQCYINAIY